MPPPDVLAGTIEDDLRSLDEKIQSGNATPADVQRYNDHLQMLQDQERKKPKNDFLKPRFRLNGYGQSQQGFGATMSATPSQTGTCGEFKNIYYEAAELPWDATDNWLRSSADGDVAVRECAPTDFCNSDGVLAITGTTDHEMMIRAEEGIISERYASVSFRMRGAVTGRTLPGEPFYGGGTVWLDDGVKSVMVFFGEDLEGNKVLLFPIEGHPVDTELNVTDALVEYFDWSGWHDYRLVRDADGMIELFVDDIYPPVFSYPFSSLNMDTVGFSGIAFGNVVENAVVNTEWDYVRYSIGMPNTDGCTSADGKMELLSLINMTKIFDPTYEANDVIGRLKIATVEGLASNTQSHKFYLRAVREIRDGAGNLVRIAKDDVQIGPIGTGKNPPDMIGEGLSSWNGTDSQGIRVADGVYTYGIRFDLLRADSKGKVKVLSTMPAAGGPVMLATATTTPRMFKNVNATKYYFSYDYVDPREVRKSREYVVRDCSLGADPILDVFYAPTGGENPYAKVASNDYWSWCGCRYPYGDCGWRCYAGSAVTITPQTGETGWVLIVVRAKALNKGGTCSLYRSIDRGSSNLWASNFRFGGNRVDWGWAVDEEIQNVTMSEGQDTLLIQANSQKFEVVLDGTGKPSWNDDGGIEKASKVTVGVALSAGSTFIGQKPWAKEGTNHIYRNDARIPGHDTDGDGLGNDLETAIGTCPKPSGYFKTGVPCNQQGFSTLDSDGDGIRDSWEVFGCSKCDPIVGGPEQHDRTRNTFYDNKLPMWGADPLRKDLFLEIDYMVASDHHHRPLDSSIEVAKTVFSNNSVLHPDSLSKTINFHVSYGQSGDNIRGGGDRINEIEFIEYADLSADLLRYFNGDQPRFSRFHRNRLATFVYGLWSHLSYDGSLGDGNRSKGCREDYFRTFYTSLNVVLQYYGYSSDYHRFKEPRTFFHELGHAMGLGHGGPTDTGYEDEWIPYKPNHISAMNYLYLNWPDPTFSNVYRYLSYSHGNDSNVYNEFHIDERHAYEVLGFRDWNRNGTVDRDTRADINRTCTSKPDCAYARPCGGRLCCVNVDACLDYEIVGVLPGTCDGSPCGGGGNECVTLTTCGDDGESFCETDDDCQGQQCGTKSFCVRPILFRDYDEWNALYPSYDYFNCADFIK